MLRSYSFIRLILLFLLFNVTAAFSNGVDNFGKTQPGRKQDNDSHLLRVVYFQSPTCQDCHKVKTAMPNILKGLEDKVSLETHNIEEIDVFDMLFKYEEHYKANVTAPPAVFVGNKYLTDPEQIIQNLRETIISELENGSVTYNPDDTGQAEEKNEELPHSIMEKFQSFSIGAVAIAGLIDGINPCAFTTIIFLLSMLAYLGKNKRQLIMVGIIFTAAIFVTYYLLGLGLFGAIKSFSVNSGLSTGIAYAIAGFTFILAGWSLLDCLRYWRSGNVKSVTLGLPKSIKKRIHQTIRTKLQTRSLMIGSFSLGCIIAVLESFCTGQVYLPTIVFVARTSAFRLDALGYLFIYNLMFIVPLIFILAIAYFGVKSESFGLFLRKHLALFKFGMAVLFAGLGILIIVTI